MGWLSIRYDTTAYQAYLRALKNWLLASLGLGHSTKEDMKINGKTKRLFKTLVLNRIIWVKQLTG